MENTIDHQEVMRPGSRRNGGGDLLRIAPLVALVYVTFLCSPEVRLQIAGLELYSYRLVILPSVLFILYRYASGACRVHIADWLVLAASGWILVSQMKLYGVAGGFISSAAIALDTAGPYFLARACIQSVTDMRRIMILILPALLLAGILVLVESIANRVIFRPYLASIFGSVNDYSEGPNNVSQLAFRNEVRLGMMRGYGTFAHPILGGLMLTCSLPLFWLSGLRSWPPYAAALAAIMSIFTVSSAAIMGLFIAVGLLAVDAAKRRFTNIGWPLITGISAVFLMAVQFGTQSGVINLISRVTLNPATAFVRQEMWFYGMRSIGKHPWFGIGQEVYEKPTYLTESIDAHFLALGVSHGVITPLALIIAVLYLIFSLGSCVHKVAAREQRNLILGLNYSLCLLMFGALTVTFFSGGRIWFMALIGFAAALHSVIQRELAVRQNAAPSRSPNNNAAAPPPVPA